MLIYLLTTDGHRDSISFAHYATNEEELKLLVARYEEELLYSRTRNLVVDMKEKTINFESSFDGEDWDEKSYHFFTISRQLVD